LNEFISTMGVSYICKNCNKRFTKKTDYERHINRKNPCIETPDLNGTKKIIEKIEKIEKINNELTYSNEKLINSNKELSNRVLKNEKEFDKRIKNLEKKISKMGKNAKQTINVNGNINNNNYQVNILPFGKEDTTFLTNAQKKTILSHGLKGPEKYVELVHCNKNKPENKNIYISNRKDKNSNVLVFDDGSWELKDVEYVDKLRDSGIEFMEGYYDDMKDKLPANIVKMMERFGEHMDSAESAKIKEKMSKKIKILLYNARPVK
jgi:hypothetical protein